MILMNDFKAEPIEIRDAMLGAASRVLESGWYVLGNEVKVFERQWATACGVEYGVGVANGMDAIEIALRALGLGHGDEVITTPMTAFASVLAILRAGATPVLADIDEDTALLSVESVSRCLTPRTKAVLLVHLYGQVRRMNDWMFLCGHHRISLIEDCAQAHLATWHGKSVGSFGEAGCFSFYPTKNLGAPGDAGMLVTNSQAISERAGRLRNYGQSVRYEHPELGMNSRLDEIHAAMLSERLKWLPAFISRRQQIADLYGRHLKNALVKLPALPEENNAHVYHLFVVTCSQREKLQEHLNVSGVQSLIHYPVCIHEQKPCLNIHRDPYGLEVSERYAATCLSLPCHPQMTDENIDMVISAVNAFKGG
jgi:dTDP-4-amino-4,6-dideoxygalactose transaminase